MTYTYNKDVLNQDNPKALLSCIAAIVLLASLLFASCSDLPHKRSYNYTSKEEAIADYREFLGEVMSVSSYKKEDMASVILQWNEMRDSIFFYLASQSQEEEPHTGIKQQFFNIDDSICNSFYEKINASNPTLSDVIYIKEHASPLAQDKDVIASRDKAEKFFVRLDSIDIQKLPKDIILRDYRRFLQRTALAGFQNKKSFASFLKTEDVYFRMFLSHLSEYQNESVQDITKYTEKVCKLIMVSDSIDSETKVIYMGMRTNRRLIQNMQTCLDDIKHLKCRTPELSNAYFCMIVQPYISLDALSSALLTKEQSKYLNDQSQNIRAVLGRTKAKENLLEMLDNQLAKQLLKVYISSINN